MLVNGVNLLQVARENSFAVPAFNISDHAMMKGIFDICEETDSPLIVAIHPDEVRHVGSDFLPAVLSRARRTRLPVAVHWDHGATYEEMLLAIQLGFTSVMIDASLQSFDDNVGVSKRVVGGGPRGRRQRRGRARHHRQGRRRGRGRHRLDHLHRA